MARIDWGYEERLGLESGVDQGVYFPSSGPGVPWNGLINVTEADSGTTESKHYVDGVKLRHQRSFGSFAAELESTTFPKEFAEYDADSPISLQAKTSKVFGLSYRTKVAEGHIIHLVYNALARPSGRDSRTIAQAGDPDLYRWTITTKPVSIQGARASAHVMVDTRKALPETLEAFENILYGTEGLTSSLPTPNEVLEVFESNAVLQVFDNGDGTYTATGPEEAITMIGDDEFKITWESAVIIDEISYQISSL